MKTTFLPIDHAAFGTLTPEARYWTGFLMADGCLTLAKRTRKSGKTVFYKMIALCLNIKDRAHVKRFRKFLKSKHKITVFSYRSAFCWTTQARFAFISPSIWKRLCALGVKPRKSQGCSISRLLAFDRDFWRGVIDGDGTVMFTKSYNKRRPIINLNGCPRLLRQFQRFVKQVLGKVYKINFDPRVKNFGTIAVTGKSAALFARILYENASVALTRKLKRARQIGTYYAN